MNALSTDSSTNTMDTNSSTPSTQSLDNITFKKLPFYEVIAEIVKPFILDGQESIFNHRLQKSKRTTIDFSLTPEQITDIAMNRDISNGKNEYVYQLQIRICLLEPNSTELTDYIPLGLAIRFENKICQLPPFSRNAQPKIIMPRRTGLPINCSEYIIFFPLGDNIATVDWIQDANTYVMVVNLVRKLTSEELLQKLKDKEPKSSEETKNDIIKKLSISDPDLAATSYRFSLVCPLGRVRMKIPAKSIKCDHLQCFDAATFILMNEKKSTWICPTCSNPCLYDDIRIESYFLDVVSSSELSEDQKEIELLTDGSWTVIENNKESNGTIAAVKEKPMDYQIIDDSDDENSMIISDQKLESTNKYKNVVKSSFVDLTVSDDEKSSQV